MREIPLTQNQVAKVDDEDFGWLSEHKWFAHRNQKTFYGERRKRSNIAKMHTTIWEHYNGPIPEKFTVDHIDRDALNNQKENLRLASFLQQILNREMPNTSGYVGVSFHKGVGKYQAQIRANNKKIHLGYFGDPREAAYIRDEAAIFYHGEFARLNFPNLEGVMPNDTSLD